MLQRYRHQNISTQKTLNGFKTREIKSLELFFRLNWCFGEEDEENEKLLWGFAALSLSLLFVYKIHTLSLSVLSTLQQRKLIK